MIKENETIELRKSLTLLKEGIISLSAMLNKSNKGDVYFGIDDDGKVLGVSVKNKTLADITHEIQNNLKPLPNKLNIQDIDMNGRKIILVHVEGDDTPYSAYGRFYIRVNDADISMEPLMLQHFFEQKEDNYSKWENQETKFNSDDVDEDLLIDFVRTANEKGRLNYIYRNSEETLQKLGLLTTNGKLNNAGLYLFGKTKPLTIKEANYPTDSRTEFGEIKEFKGNIFECIREAISYIQNHISYKSLIVGVQREEIPEIPVRAIREIVINSFAHASYAKSGDFNQYTIFKSSIRIYNPGPILQNINPTRFASGKVGSKIRNILIASVLFKYGLIDSFGTGFDRTFTLCAQNGTEYRYINDEFGFTFIFERNVNFLNGKIIDKRNDNTNSFDKKVISTLKDNKYLTIPELATILKKSQATIYRSLDKLMKLNIVKRVGARKTGYWDILN